MMIVEISFSVRKLGWNVIIGKCPLLHKCCDIMYHVTIHFEIDKEFCIMMWIAYFNVIYMW